MGARKVQTAAQMPLFSKHFLKSYVISKEKGHKPIMMIMNEATKAVYH